MGLIRTSVNGPRDRPQANATRETTMKDRLSHPPNDNPERPHEGPP